jgi:hypothetical protein
VRKAVFLRLKVLWCAFILLFLICLAPLHLSAAGTSAKGCQTAVDLGIIAAIESSNNPLAYNHRSQARGLYQITPICLKEYCQFNNILVYDADYLFNPAFNTKVAEWYLTKRIPQMLKAYGLSVTLENILWAYNAGIGKVKKNIMPKETKLYIAKYKKLSPRSLRENHLESALGVAGSNQPGACLKRRGAK